MNDSLPSPSSFGRMNSMSALFKLSMFIRVSQDALPSPAPESAACKTHKLLLPSSSCVFKLWILARRWWKDTKCAFSTLFIYLSDCLNCERVRMSLCVFQRCHNYMTEQLGIPVWGSYVIFGLATLFSGLALGLVRISAALPF